MNKHSFFLFLIFCIPAICKSQNNQLDAEDRRHGPWKVNFDGTTNPKFEGEFDHGKEIGVFKFFKKGYYDHPAAIMNFNDGKDSVQVTYYTQKGKPISKGKMLDKKREGKWTYFHQESDSIMMTEQYKNDKLHGLQETFFTNGNLAEKTKYLNGEKNGESLIFADNGQVTKKLNYKNGKLHGSAIYYTPKGEKTMEGNYTEGSKTGHWKYYQDGTLEKEEDY
ncbi:toxin-antitoxin system YwqK family antitoxin [Christiangramia echinicola]|uniref:toxin-antitoxin system YwqK family antitoxin n=1 Tax=Christiangramia echinicola TaxID=279359 RepID=UPI0003FC2284|nr:aspartic peptidase [Christiangramia echinicola]